MKYHLITFLMLAGLLGAGRVAAQDETNAPPLNDYRTFQTIAQHNIFNPNRRPRTTTTISSGPTVRYDSFSLLGTMTYAKGQYAFFDGSSSQYRKTLNVGQSIAGYKIAAINANSIELAAASNKTINLPVGTQMRRRTGGRWTFAGNAEPIPDSESSATAAAPSTSTPGAAPTSAPASGGESDALKRLMQRRLEEK